MERGWATSVTSRAQSARVSGDTKEHPRSSPGRVPRPGRCGTQRPRREGGAAGLRHTPPSSPSPNKQRETFSNPWNASLFLFSKIPLTGVAKNAGFSGSLFDSKREHVPLVPFALPPPSPFSPNNIHFLPDNFRFFVNFIEMALLLRPKSCYNKAMRFACVNLSRSCLHETALSF